MNQPTLVSYSRVSSGKQVKGTGLAQQKDQKILNQLSEEYGIPVDERTFSDAGVSGYHSHNLQGEFGRILTLISSGSIATGSIIVITSLDRLSRAKTNEAMELMLSVINRGVSIYTSMDSKLYSSSSSNLTADLIVSVIIMAQAHEESLKKSHRTKGAALQMVLKHQEGVRALDGSAFAIKSVGSLPWWVDATDGTIKLNEQHATAIRTIVSKVIDGWGSIRILDYLAEKEFVSPVGDSWTYDVIAKLHRRRSLMGEYSLNLDGVKYELVDYIPAVLTETDYYQFASIKKKRVHSRSSTGKKSFLTGTGITKCRFCGGSIASSLSQGKVRLVCVNKAHRKASCDGFSILATPIEQAVLDSVGQMVYVPIVSTAKPDGMKDAVVHLEGKLAQVAADYEEMPNQTLLKMISKLELELEAKKAEHEAELLNHVVDDWVINEVPDDIDSRRELFRRSFSSIQVFKVKRFEYVISMYSERGFNTHIYTKLGKILKSGAFYDDPEQEAVLADRMNFQLWVAEGKLNDWLALPSVFDPAKDEL